MVFMETRGSIESIWSDQKSRRDKSGHRWNFRYWYAGTLSDPSCKAARLFFWDDQKRCCGVVLIPPGAVKPYSRLRFLIEKVVADEKLRRRYERELQFPLEDYYSEYPAFPEEGA